MLLQRPFETLQHWKKTHCNYKRRHLQETEQYDLRRLYTQKKRKQFKHSLSYFLSARGRINLHDDSSPSESLFKPVKKFTNVSRNTTQGFFIFIFRDNTICKEGIFSDVLGVKFRRKFKTLTNMCTTDEWNTFAALCYHAFFFGTVAQSSKTWGGSFQLAVFLKSLIHRFHTLELIKTPLVKKRTKKGSIAKVWKISETDSKKYLQSKNIFLNFYLQYFLCFVAVAVVAYIAFHQIVLRIFL